MKILLLDDLAEVVGYPGYFVSRDGRVFGKKSNELKQYVGVSGYLRVKVGGKPLHVHRLVAATFTPNPGNLSDVNHKDGNKLNNSAANLEWCTRRENLHHAMRNGLHANPETAIVGVNEETGEGLWLVSQAAAKRFGFTQPLINKCLKGLRPHHKGWRWYYQNSAT